jgi:hypothetical protein
MLHVSLLAWVATIGAIAALFALDLFVSRPGHAHTVGFREAVLASVFYVAVAIAFGVAFGAIAGWDHGTEYFAGYIVEKSLSVDNLFVRRDHDDLRGSRRVPAAGAHLRHPRCADHARDLHRSRRGAHRDVLVHVRGLWRPPRAHCDSAIPPSRPGPGRGGQRDRAGRTPRHSVHRRLRGRAHAHPQRRAQRPHAAVPRLPRHREQRPAVRARLDPSPSSASPRRLTSSSRPTRSRCWACERSTSS